MTLYLSINQSIYLPSMTTYCKFPTECASEKKIKIGQHNITWIRVSCLLFDSWCTKTAHWTYWL